MLDSMLGQAVVVDLRCQFVCLGILKAADDHYLELHKADLHDLRDSDTTREHYVASSRDTGIKVNRKRVLLVRSEVVAVSLLADVTDQ